jgi:hypothetical protein
VGDGERRVIMAWGVACKNCGWQDTDHDNWLIHSKEEEKLRKTVVPGRSVSLEKCPGFEYSDEGLLEAFRTASRETDGFEDQEGRIMLEGIYEEMCERGIPLPEGFSAP